MIPLHQAQFALRALLQTVGGFDPDKKFGNSGIQYRSRHLPPSNDNKWIVGGYQADCDLTNGYTGICYEEREGAQGLKRPPRTRFGVSRPEIPVKLHRSGERSAANVRSRLTRGAEVA